MKMKVTLEEKRLLEFLRVADAEAREFARAVPGLPLAMIMVVYDLIGREVGGDHLRRVVEWLVAKWGNGKGAST